MYTSCKTCQDWSQINFGKNNNHLNEQIWKSFEFSPASVENVSECMELQYIPQKGYVSAVSLNLQKCISIIHKSYKNKKQKQTKNPLNYQNNLQVIFNYYTDQSPKFFKIIQK